MHMMTHHTGANLADQDIYRNDLYRGSTDIQLSFSYQTRQIQAKHPIKDEYIKDLPNVNYHALQTTNKVLALPQ